MTKVYMVLFDVRSLLIPGFFRNDQIDIRDRREKLREALLVTEVAFLLLLAPVAFIGGKLCDQIIAILFRPPEQIDMTVMQQVKGPVRDDSLHFLSPVLSKLVLSDQETQCQSCCQYLV